VKSHNAAASELIRLIRRNKLKNGATALALQIKAGSIVLAGDRYASASVVDVLVEIAAAQKEATGLAHHFAARFAHL
jgi:hypothetical protein